MPKSRTRNWDAVRLGLILRRLRMARGWTILRVAEAAGMNPKYVGTIEAGGNIPSIESLIRLSHVLGADPPEVLREMIQSRATPAVRRKS